MKNKVKQFRQWEGLTQEQLALKAGVSRQTIWAIEAGNYVPSAVLALKISLILKKKAEDLFELEDEDWKD